MAEIPSRLLSEKTCIRALANAVWEKSVSSDFDNLVRALCSILLLVLLAGCSKQPLQSSTAELIHYRTGPTTSTLLTGEDYKGISAATETLRYRSPQVAVYDSYIVISYPGTDMKERVIQRNSLIELQWKK